MTVTIDPAYIKNDWVQLSLTFNLTDKTVRIYQNDTLLAEYVDSDMFEALDNNLTVIVGKSRDDDKYFKGLIDNCTVYDTILETNEIGSLYYDSNHMKLELNTWSHITGNYSSINNQVSTYINGELAYKKTYLPSNVTNSNNIDIGKGFSGEISELMIAERPFYESEISYLSTDVMRFDELFPLLSFDIQERNTTQLSDVSGLNNHGTVTGGPPIYVYGYKRGTYAVRLTAEQDIQIDNSLITDYDFNNFLLNISVRVSSLPSEIQLIHSNEFTISLTASALKLVVGGDTVSLDIGTLENDTFIQLMVQVSLVKAKLIVFRKDTGNKYETAFNHTIQKITSALTCCGTNFEGDLQDLDISLGYGIENNTFEQTMYSVYQNDFTIPPVPFSDMTVHNMVTNDGVISGTTDGEENYAEYSVSLPIFLQVEITPASGAGNHLSLELGPNLGFGIENGSLYLNIQGKQAYSSSLISSESVDVPIALFMDDIHLIYYLYGEEVTRVSRTVDSVLWDDVANDVACRLVSNSSSGGFKNFQVLDKNIYSTMPPHTIVSSSLFDYIGTIHLKYDIDTDADGNSDKLNFVSTQGGSTAARHILSKNTNTLPLYVECIVKPGNVANAFGLHVFRLSTNTAVNLHTVGDVNGMVFGIFNNNYYYSQSGSVYTDTSSVANTVNGVEYKLAIYATEEHILLYHNNNLVKTISASTDSTFWDNYVSDGGKIGFYSNDAGDTSMRSFVTLNYNPKATTSAVAFSDILHYTTDQLYYNYNVSHFDRIAYNSASNHTDIGGKMHTISKQSYKLPLFLECELKTSNSFVGLHLFSIDKLQPTESEIDAEMDGIVWGTGKNTNELYYKICNDVSTSSSTTDPFLQYFTKFAIYVDDVKIRLYQDGILKKTVRKSENALFWNNLSYDQMGYFGIYGESGGSQFRNLVIASRDLYYKPDMSPVHIESYVKTVERIITIADYDFNQSSGTVVNSLSNGTNGVLNQGTGSYPTRLSPSYFENGMSMKFERSGWIDIMSDASWSDLSNLSLSVWIKPTLDGSENMLIEANKYRIGINGAGNLFFSVGNETEMTTTVVKTVTVATVDGSNVYFIDGTQETTLDLIEGNTYVFDWSAATSHPLRFSETLDGPNGGGSEYTSGVTVDSGASTTTIIIDTSTPRQFYFYCEYHSGMGAAVNVNTNPNPNFERLVCTNYTLTTDYWVNIGITIDSFNKKIAFYSNNQLQSYHTVLSDMTNHLISGTDVVKVGNGFLGSMDSFQLFKGVVSQLVLSENSKRPSQQDIQKLPTSRYTHVAAVYDSSKNMITTYVDGEYNVCYENYLQDYRTIGTNDSNINIAFNDDNQFFDGLLDDIRIYDKSLNEAQIKSIYDSYHKEVWITDFNFNYSNKVYSVVGREPVNIPANFTIDTYIIATLDDVFQTEEQLINLVQSIVSVNEVNPYRKITYTTTGSTTEGVQYSYSPITFSYYYDSITTTDSIANIDSFTELKFHLITKSYDGTYLFMSKVIER